MNLITIQNLTDGTTARSFVNYESTTDATSALYTTMAYSVANEAVTSAICVLMDDNGVPTKREKWQRPFTPEPVKEEEQTEEEE